MVDNISFLRSGRVRERARERQRERECLGSELRIDLRSSGGYLRSGGPCVSGSLSWSVHPCPPVVQPDVTGAVRLSFCVPLSVSSDLLLFVARFLQPSLSEWWPDCSVSAGAFPVGNLPPTTFSIDWKSPDFLFFSDLLLFVHPPIFSIRVVASLFCLFRSFLHRKICRWRLFKRPGSHWIFCSPLFHP